MININGKDYISDKECEKYFGFSRDWFQKQRSLKKGPPYIKIEGKVLYDLKETEQWFENHMKRSEDEEC